MKTALIALALAAALPAQAAGLDLSSYRLTGTHSLPGVEAAEASAISYNHDTGTFFVLGDEGDYVVEVDQQGRKLNAMYLFGFDDTEGLTYVGGNQFVLVEERLQDVYRFTFNAGGSVGRSALPSVSLGASVGNVGLEGLSYDAASGAIILVKEKTPQAVYEARVDFSQGTGSLTTLVNAGTFAQPFGTLDLADVQVLSGVTSLKGTTAAGNLLVLSQETPRLMEVTRSGQVLSSFDLSALGTDIEGVTVTPDGTIYLVGETPRLYVLSAAPVPEPSTWALALAGLGLTGLLRRRRA